MHDSFPIPSCFNSGTTNLPDDRSAVAAATKSGQSVVMSVYRTKIAGASRLITVTWCRRGLSVSVEGSDACEHNDSNHGCIVELRPWYFWRKYGSKKLNVEGTPVNVFWDLRNASFSGEPEPRSGYYVAVIAGDEVILLLGDLKKDAYRRTGSRPSLIEAALVSKKEHVFGKRRFATRAKFHNKGRLHEISIECIGGTGGNGGGKLKEPEMVFKIDGHVAIHVKHLQWKFRGNQSISMKESKVDVYWDVHDWLFSPGLRHALFIFKPSPVTTGSSMSPVTSTSLSSLFSSSVDGSEGNGGGGELLSGFSLFLYAWMLE